ncbi:unnamed protein product [Clonostachys solani]|uniref:FAD-binding PCMH-type domain-containing protein n=1 Tax=Clonostachys solani TaxID=160281 RepID=A0A9N9ZGA6_9HYPO|nr:unnamed protein product [Clonostachys solani]
MLLHLPMLLKELFLLALFSQVLCLDLRALTQLNDTLGGRLASARPTGAPCFSEDSKEECALLGRQIMSPDYRHNTYQSFENIQGEACIANPSDQCLLDPTTLQAPTDSSSASSCGQGVVSRYFIQVTGAEDVQAVFRYSRKTGHALSIKNSGHDYMMRSSRQGSLAMWTGKLRNMTYHESFSPDGCDSGAGIAPAAAITLGAGVSMGEAMAFSHDHGVLFPAAISPSIGASGGWLLNGGHSPMSVGMGLAVDRAAQFTIVTPDGKLRTVNRCRDKELFWALRGGGGGAFGVVLGSTHFTKPEVPVVAALFNIANATAETRRGWVELLADHMLDWTLEGWGGPSTTSMSVLVNPYLNVSEAERMLEPAAEYMQQRGGAASFQTYPSWFDFWTQVVTGMFSAPPTVSLGVNIASKILPKEAFTDHEKKGRMVDAIMNIEASGMQVAFLATTPILYGQKNPGASKDTSINPAWYRSVWHLSGYSAWNYKTTLDERKETVLALQNTTEVLDAISDGGCTYSNEADPSRKDWASEYWGDNYPKLLQVKHKVDPHNLLSCWHCVGWEPSLPSYGCISGLYEQ